MYKTSGEHVIWKVNRHWLVPTSNLLFSAPLMLVVLILALGLADRQGRLGSPVSFVVGFAVVGAWFGLPMLSWAATSITLTTHRVIIERGFVNQVRIAVPYDRIQDVHVRQNLAGRVFGYGTIDLGIGTSNGPVRLHHMPLRGLREHLMDRVLPRGNRSVSEADDRRAV